MELDKCDLDVAYQIAPSNGKWPISSDDPFGGLTFEWCVQEIGSVSSPHPSLDPTRTWTGRMWAAIQKARKEWT